MTRRYQLKLHPLIKQISIYINQFKNKKSSAFLKKKEFLYNLLKMKASCYTCAYSYICLCVKVFSSLSV